MKIRGMWLPLLAALALPGALGAQEDERAPRRGMIGVQFESESGRTDGVRVIEVRPGSPAAAAGVREGDIVLRVNGGEAARGMTVLPSNLQAGDTVRLRLRREGGDEREVVVVAAPRPVSRFSMVRPGGDNLIVINGDSVRIPLQELTGRLDSLNTVLMGLQSGSFRVEMDSLVRMLTDSTQVWVNRIPSVEIEGEILEAMPMEGGQAFFMELGRRAVAGAELTEMNEGLSAYFGGQREGALVVEVTPESPAARAGLQSGDVIVRAGGQDVADPADVRSALARAGEGRVALEVVRQGRRRELSLEWTGGVRVFHSEGRARVPGEQRQEIRQRVRVRTQEN
ncbi:MAG TPA: PDZ domain-containing protein [Longimicrobium sp.]|nr:PDZ domain-containing protein [Longimicrobium sp.]